MILGRPLLVTSNALINCHNGLMQLSFSYIIVALNIFHLGQLDDDHGYSSLNLNFSQEVFDELEDRSMVIEDPLELCLAQDGLSPQVSESIGQIHALLNYTPQENWKLKHEPLILSRSPILSSTKCSHELESLRKCLTS